MNITGIVGAVVAGVVGALIWAAIAYFANVEIGYVAWGIGFLVGFGSAALGGQGVSNGALCAILALISILGGKMLATKFTISKAMDEAAATTFAEYKVSADGVQGLSTDEDYANFIVSDGWTDVESAAEISADEVAGWKAEWLPFFAEIKSGAVTSENWRATPTGQQWESNVQSMLGQMGQGSLIEMVKEDLGAMDLLFAFLGVITAFKVGCGSDEEEGIA